VEQQERDNIYLFNSEGPVVSFWEEVFGITVDDQILQVCKDQTIWFSISDDSIWIILEQEQRRSQTRKFEDSSTFEARKGR
jgi:hypothetical protein